MTQEELDKKLESISKKIEKKYTYDTKRVSIGMQLYNQFFDCLDKSRLNLNSIINISYSLKEERFYLMATLKCELISGKKVAFKINLRFV